MKTIACLSFFCLSALTINAQLTPEKDLPTAKTANGILQGTITSGISMFKGIPFAQPPVGELRWREPQPVKNWEGIRKADHFAPRAMQLPIFPDMQFRSDSASEDCLYLNIWTPAKTGKEELPVLVYFYGGGLMAGDGSEYRYDGESMARRGIVAVTVNYRLGIFGFMAHPELTKESSHHASGNYGFLDQTEALRWVHKNIAAFGGNPDKITIAGESAGSFSVSAQVVSPLPRNLFAAAIGESGSLIGFTPLNTLRESENLGQHFADTLGAKSIKELRAISAAQILKATARPGARYYAVDVDGYFFPDQPLSIYKSGNVAKVPLLVGWNSGEGSWKQMFGQEKPTKENFEKILRKTAPDQADELLKVYVVTDDSEVERVASEMVGDRFIAFGTWRWAELQSKTNSPVYRYYFMRARPGFRLDINKTPVPAQNAGSYRGAAHSAEIEYAMGNLPSNRVYDWQPDDYLVSAIMQDYFVNFIKTKNPNGIGLPYWPLYQSWQKDPVLWIDVDTKRQPDKRQRYLYLEKTAKQ